MHAERIVDLAERVCERLWAVFDGDATDVRLMLPVTRGGAIRVSEQESKIMMCQVLEEAELYYSVEAPTRQRYQQSGSFSLSARLDLTVYAAPITRERALNIELKAGNPPVESFRKDFEKLVREGVPGLWFHTLTSMNRGTLPSVLAKMRQAIRSVDEYALAASHGITFVICVLDRRLVLSAHLPLGAGVSEAADRVFDSLAAEWNAGGVGADDYRARRVVRHTSANTGERAQRRDVRGSTKLLIYCPQIASDTFLHFSQRGDSYRLRAFSGTMAGKQPWMQPETHSASEFLRLYAPQKTIDVREEATPLDEIEIWARIVEQHNRELGRMG